MNINPNLFSMQIDVPHSVHGHVSYFMPNGVHTWMKENNLEYSMCGSSSSGDGLTNGISNEKTHYMVRNMQEQDGTAFALLFPECRVHVSKQYVY